MPTVLITPEALRDKEGPHTQVLREAGFEYRFPKNPQLARGGSEQELINELDGIDATLASMEPYSEHVLQAVAGKLRVIARVGVGYDAVDVAAATAQGVLLTITPTANHEAVAEMALALLLAIAKQLLPNDRKMRSGVWARELISPIRGGVLGLVGLGRIGRSTAVRGQALGMTVVAHDPLADKDWAAEHRVQLVDLPELLQCADYVSLHCPLNQDTESFMNAEAFSLMKPGAVLINTARGKLVNEQALVEALKTGRLAGAGLDVMRQEPPPVDHPLLSLDQVILSPHLAGCDRHSLRDMATEAATCIVSLHQGKVPTGALINHEAANNWRWSRP